jgi:tripartite-type tricarboxylate transporter receptor subunit TctC
VYVAALAVLMLAAQAWAQAWPAKPVRVVVPLAPGALTDSVARALAAELGRQLGHAFVVENRGGAGGTLGTALVAKSAPDGHTVAFTDNSFMISAALYPKMPYDPLKDLVAVTLAVEVPAILVARHGLPAQTLREAVALARSRPRTLTYGSAGRGSTTHLATELFQIQAGMDLVHVPFKRASAARAALIEGRIDLAMSSIGAAAAQVRSGKLRPLAVSGRERSALLPDVPTFAEFDYPNYDMVYRFGFLAPAGTAPQIVNRLQQEVATAAGKRKLRDFLSAHGARAPASTPAEYGEVIEREIRTWTIVAERVGVKLE